MPNTQMDAVAGGMKSPAPGEPAGRARAYVYTVPKEKLFETQTGRNLVDFYMEKVLPKYCPDGCDVVRLHNEWFDSFARVEVRIFVNELRIGFIFLDSEGRRVDEHYEDIYDTDHARAIMMDLSRVAGGFVL